MIQNNFNFINKITFNLQQKLLTHRAYRTEINSGYKPKDVERKILPLPKKSTGNSKFSIILPPPNVTGHLHIGHALMSTIQDVLVRWNRIQGTDALWIPGTDHAGLATQLVVEKKLFKERNLTRHDLGKEAFLKEVWKWKNEKENKIKDDLNRLGSSLNWEREFYTMDSHHSEAVTTAFIRLFEDNLIYRSKSLVNWSCALESAISDIEVDDLNIPEPTALTIPGYSKPIMFGQIAEIAYKVSDSDREIVVATTRPETLLGDVAVAVHPNDSRYSTLLTDKCRLEHPFRLGESIPLIADDAVDQSFGTGAVKVTPAHDRFDFDLAERHQLKSLPVINEKGLICEGYNELSGLPRFEARHRVLNRLSSMGLLKNIKPHRVILPICSRSKDVVEYLLRPQWFVRSKELSESAIKAVQNGSIKIHPSNFEQEWNRWLAHPKDWCISRQVWWGHQIPAFKCSNKEKSVWISARNETEAKSKAVKELNENSSDTINVIQDQDVLDTWFSSALLPFSALGWPHDNPDLKKYYPLDVMETGHDILFFWVARMVMLGIHLTGQVPFRSILLHGIVCDAHGRKMSKSLGNVIHPEQIILGSGLDDLKNEIVKLHENGILSEDELKKSLIGQEKLFPNGIPECGIDALRFTLCSHNIKSHFVNFDVAECYSNKLFFNKIWQATRYTLRLHEKHNLSPTVAIDLNKCKFSDMDRWILSRLAQTVDTVSASLNDYNLHLATNALKTFFYSNFCDVYLETTKTNANNVDQVTSNCNVLRACLAVELKNMECFTPFLSTELLQYFPEKFVFNSTDWIDKNLELEIDDILSICSSIRQVKSERNILKKHQPCGHLFVNNIKLFNRLEHNIENIKHLTQCSDIVLHQIDMSSSTIQFIVQSTANHLCSFGIQTNGLCEQNVKLNKKKLEKLEKELEKLLKTISNDGYRKSANDVVQEKHLKKIDNLRTEITNIKSMEFR